MSISALGHNSTVWQSGEGRVSLTQARFDDLHLGDLQPLEQDTLEAVPLFPEVSAEQTTEQGYDTLNQGLMSLVHQKIAFANQYAEGAMQSPSKQVGMLLSAFSDCEWVINNILKDFGNNVPPSMQGLISNLKGTQLQILGMITKALGTHVSPEQLLAMLQRDPSKESGSPATLQDILALRQGDFDKLAKFGLAGNSAQTDQQQDETATESHPLKMNQSQKNQLLASGSHTMSQDLQQMIQRASNLMQQASGQPGPKAIPLLMAALGLIEKGLMLSQIGHQAQAGQSMPISLTTAGSNQADSSLEMMMAQVLMQLEKQGVQPDVPTDLVSKSLAGPKSPSSTGVVSA